jgi:hypothetical protein
VASLMIPGGHRSFGSPHDVRIERRPGPVAVTKHQRPVGFSSAICAVCTNSHQLVWHPPPGKAQVGGGAPGARRRPVPAPGLRHSMPPRDPPDPVLRRPDRGRSDRPWGSALRT